jgi:hypothetical protein
MMDYHTPNAKWIGTVNLHRHPSGIGNDPKPPKRWYENDESVKKMRPAPKNWSPRR